MHFATDVSRVVFIVRDLRRRYLRFYDVVSSLFPISRRSSF